MGEQGVHHVVHHRLVVERVVGLRENRPKPAVLQAQQPHLFGRLGQQLLGQLLLLLRAGQPAPELRREMGVQPLAELSHQPRAGHLILEPAARVQDHLRAREAVQADVPGLHLQVLARRSMGLQGLPELGFFHKPLHVWCPPMSGRK